MSLREVNYLKWLKDLHSRRILRPNLLDDSGLSQVHHCAYRGFLSCLKWLAKHGGSLAASSAEGSSAAHYAAAGGHLEVLQWIYRRSSRSVVFRDHNGATPLYFAAQEGHLDCLEWLTKRTTTVHSEASIDGMTAVHAAAQEGHLECLVFLIQCAGCSGLARDKAGCIPMHFAAAGGHRSCVSWLSLHGWGTGNERNKSGSSPLHVAAEHGHLEVVKLLMRSGAKADLYDRHGRTAYDIAVETGNEACAQFLLQASHKALNGMVANIFTHQSSLKRVRFERKAIEKGIRDSNPNLTESQTLEAVNQSHYSQARDLPDRIQRSRSLVYPSYESYRDAARLGVRTYSTSNLNNNSHSNNTNSSNNRVSLTNYLSNFDSSLTPSLEGVSRNGIPRGPTPPVRSHRPIQRTYSAPIPDVSSEAVGEASGKRAGGGVSRSQSMRQSIFTSRPFRIGTSSDQYEVTGSDTSTLRPNVSSLLTALKNKATKSKDQIPSESEPYNPKDLIPFPVESNDLNIFRRLYRMSKRKLTRTTSLSINDEEYIAKPREKHEKFLVTGTDTFIPGSSDQHEGPEITSQIDQPMDNGHVPHESFHGQETGKKIVSFQQRPLSTDFTLDNIRAKMRDNALIW